MDIFLTLFFALLPLYGLIVLGFIAGRWLEVDRHSLAQLVLFIFLPIMLFGFIADLELKASYALLPVLIYSVQASVAFIILALGRRIFGDNRANLLAMCSSMGNTGFFGLPLVVFLFEAQWVALYMFVMIGGAVFEATVGYYLAARGNFSAREALIKLMKYPSIYAIILALIVNLTHTPLPEAFYIYWGYFKGCYVVAGMMILGVALAHMKGLVFGKRFMTVTLIGKFVLFPLLMGGFILLDKVFLGWFALEIHQILFVMAIVPPAAGVAAFATQLDLRPEKAATTVLIGTIFALFYIPVALMFFDLY